MQQRPQLESPDRSNSADSDSDTGKLVEDLHRLLGILRRGWRFIAISVAICLTLAVVYLARTKTVYESSARLLVLQQGGRPVNVSGGADALSFPQTAADSLATHLMIIRSPVIVEKALASAGLRNIPADSVIARLTVKLPDEGARVLDLGYKAGTEDETTRVIKAVIESYDQFLKDNYQKNTTEVISLITKARDELDAEINGLHKKLQEFRENNPTDVSEEGGRSFAARRLDQWDQRENQVVIRELQLKMQLELGRKLAGQGVGTAAILTALNQLGSLGEDGKEAPVQPGTADGTGFSTDRLDDQLRDVAFQRLTAESLLGHLRAELTSLASSRTIDDAEVSRVFSTQPDAAKLYGELEQVQARQATAQRLVRKASDPSLQGAASREGEIKAALAQLWRQRRPEIRDHLAHRALAEEETAIRKAEVDLVALRAKEAALREARDQFRADHLGQLRQELGRLTQRNGPSM
jgi:capsular polysaccharide biosynthesis protein